MEYNLLASFSEIVSMTGYVLLAILALLIMITVHEFGHYASGKLLGFGIEEFSIGFGPRLFGKKKKDGEVFSVRLLPVGGYCAFIGEDAEDENPKAFNNKKPWQRLIVLVSGALMNYLFAVLIIAVTFFAYGQTAYRVPFVCDDAAISQDAFCVNDVILKAEGKNIYLLTDLMSATSGKKVGDSVTFTVLRDGKTQDIEVILKADADFDNVEDWKQMCVALGIYQTDADGNVSRYGFYTENLSLSFFETIGRSFEYSLKLAASIFMVLGQLITGALGVKSVGGTVTTVAVTARAIKTGGLHNLLNISGYIGVNLAVFNLLPIPALDGSRAVFTVIEWIRKKPINRRVEGIIHTVGLAAILLFAVFVDLQQCF